MEVTNLKAYLANIGMSMKDFCHIIEISHRHMSKIVNGTSRPSQRLAKDIKEATGGVVVLEAAPAAKKGVKKSKPKKDDKADSI